jgi:hypothetical protein
MQYTIRNVPRQLDLALRRRANRERRTLNEIAIEAMADGLGLVRAPVQRRSVRDLLGARGKDRELEQALADQRRIDPDLWS